MCLSGWGRASGGGAGMKGGSRKKIKRGDLRKGDQRDEKKIFGIRGY